MTTQTLERSEGVAALEKATKIVKSAIEEMGGMFNVQMPVS